MSELEDELAGLMRAAQAGDAAAYRRLLSALADMLRRWVRRELARQGYEDCRGRGHCAGNIAGHPFEARELGPGPGHPPLAARGDAAQADRQSAPARAPW